MIHEIRAPKLLDWFIVNVVKPGRHAEDLRLLWKDGGDLVGRAGWSLTTDRVVKKPEGLDLDALLRQIEREMKKAPEQKQWAMNHCLAELGIHNPNSSARDRHRQEAGRAHRLSGIARLYFALRAGLDRRDGSPP